MVFCRDNREIGKLFEARGIPAANHALCQLHISGIHDPLVQKSGAARARGPQSYELISLGLKKKHSGLRCRDWIDSTGHWKLFMSRVPYYTTRDTNTSCRRIGKFTAPHVHLQVHLQMENHCTWESN